MKWQDVLFFRDIYNASAGSFSSWVKPKKYIKFPVIYILLTITSAAASDDNKGRSDGSSEL